MELDSLFTALGGVEFETEFKDEGFNSGGWSAGYCFDFIGSDLGYAMHGYIVFAYWNLLILRRSEYEKISAAALSVWFFRDRYTTFVCVFASETNINMRLWISCYFIFGNARQQS